MAQQVDNSAAVMALRNLYAGTAKELVDQPFGNVAYVKNGRGTVVIPTGFLSKKIIAHVHEVFTIANAGASSISALGIDALVEEFFFTYNGSESTIFSADAIYTRLRAGLENPSADSTKAETIPNVTGPGTFTWDAYYEIPNVYSDASLMGVLNLNSNEIHAGVGVRFGDVANCVTLAGGQTCVDAGGSYVEFLAERETQPTNVQTDGMPDLTKTFTVGFQDFPLASSKNNKLVLQADHTVTRIILQFLQGGTGNGSDVASYDTSNALQVQNIKLGWASMIKKYDVPYWYFQQQAAKHYGTSPNVNKFINKGTVIIDLDRFGGRDWIDAFNVTNLAATVDLGAAPAAGSKCRVYLEQVVNTSSIPIR